MTLVDGQVDEFAPAKEPATKPAAPEPVAVAPEPAPANEPVTKPVAPEPEQANAYDSIIKQQTEQINALIAQNQSLTDQMTKLIQNGAQIGQPQQVTPLQQFAPPALSDNDDWSLEALGREMAKDKR